MANIIRDRNGCWIWQLRTSNGYGQIKVRGKTLFAHRFSYEVHVGRIPEGLQLDHLCRVTACVNPAHLEAVTPRENTLRGVGPSAVNASKATCHRGHELTPVQYGDGRHRLCFTCQHAAEKRWRDKDREPCAIDGCLKSVQVRGLCRTHYAQRWRAGAFLSVPVDDLELIEP